MARGRGRDVFRKRAAPEEEIDDDLLANIPDLEPAPRAAPAAPATVFAPVSAPVAAPSVAPPQAAPAVASGDVHALLAEARRHMEASFGKELGRVEETFSGLVHDLRARLAQTEAELAAAKGENDGLRKAKAEYDRKFEVLRELARPIDKA